VLEGDSLGRERFIAGLFTTIELLGLVFAVSDLYCIQSYLVAQRSREFGVRIALGAGRSHILGLVARSNLSAVGIGTGAGIALSLALGHVFAQLTTRNSRDPWMLLTIVAVFLLAAVAGSMAPARLAASISPTDALRSQ
jgi:ABC-type antimicrobial peptide transport system permease subunit